MSTHRESLRASGPSLTTRWSEGLHQLIRQTNGRLTNLLARSTGPLDVRQLPNARQPDQIVTSVCGFCATGCSLDVHRRAGDVVNVLPTLSYPVNQGTACPKGWEAMQVLQSSQRAAYPMLRQPDGTLRRVSWDAALSEFRNRFQEIQREAGPESVAFLGTGQLTTEELAFLGCLAKFGLGMVHGDGNTRQCMATAATAYKESFGFDAPPYTYDDFECSDVLVLVGGNPCIAHPILWRRILNNPSSPMIIVVDPRCTETAAAASWHIALQPKSDLWLFYAVAHVLLRDQRIDQNFLAQHVTGLDSLRTAMQAYSPAAVSPLVGLTVAQIERLAAVIADGRRVSFWWTMGVNQSFQGTRTAQALINLALLTGNIGRAGTGANSITGQCNAMGSRLYSNTTNLIAGRDFRDRDDRTDVARILQIDVDRIPSETSWPYHRILQAIHQREIRGLWVVCTNPAHSWIDQDAARAAFRKLDFLVVQDMMQNTETAQLADLILPAAAWGEKLGTFINSERRWGLVQPAQAPPGEALPDFEIFRRVAETWGCADLFTRWTDPEAVFRILQELSEGRPCDISGISGYAHLLSQGGIQWPCRTADEGLVAHRRLFADGQFYHADRKARLISSAPQTMPEPVDESYPYVLLTGRGTAAQWHTQSRTANSATLRALYPEAAYVEIHPQDAAREGLQAGDPVQIISRRATTEARACLTHAVSPGQLFLPMHYPGTNRLTLAHFDPHSHQPSYKDCAVRLATVRPSVTDAPRSGVLRLISQLVEFAQVHARTLQ